MKKILLSVAAIACLTLLTHAQQSTPDIMATGNPNAPEIAFDTEVIDYGTIEHNSDGNREFKFKNVGKEPLIISNATGSCGCTVPTWPKEPIMPGKEGSIKVKYATDRVGAFEKTVTVTTNGRTTSKVLRIKGVVKPDPAPSPVPPLASPAPVPAEPKK